MIETKINFEEMKKKALTEIDASLYVYMVRDLPEVKATGLFDLAWCMAEQYCARSEVVWFFEELERRCKNG